jgi:hypothetical protein
MQAKTLIFAPTPTSAKGGVEAVPEKASQQSQRLPAHLLQIRFQGVHSEVIGGWTAILSPPRRTDPR